MTRLSRIVTCAAVFVACAGFASGAQLAIMPAAGTALNATAGLFFNIAFSASGGNGNYGWAQQGLPASLGMNLNAVTGILSGTPPAGSAGNYPFTVIVHEINGPNLGMANYALQVSAGVQPPVITTASLPAGTAGFIYTAVTIMAIGGTPPYTFSAASLPAGMNISAGGVLGGMPAANAAGSYSVVVTVADSQGMKSSRQYLLIINASTPMILTTVLPPGEVGVSYSQTLMVSGGIPPYSFGFVMSGGAVPPGLGIGQSGTLAGTPTVAGTFAFTVVVVDSFGTQATHSYTVTIAPPLANTTLSISSGVAGASYSQPMVAMGGVPPYTFVLLSITASGLTLNPGTGVLSGTLPQPGTYTVVVQILDSLNAATSPQQYSLVVTAAGPALQLSTTTLSFTSQGGVDLPPDQAIAVTSTTGNPVAYSARADSGTPTSPTPQWLRLRRSSGSTPDLFIVGVDPNAPVQPAGSHTARIRFFVTGDNSQPEIDVTVSYAVMAAAPHLSVLPGFLRFAARLQAPGTLQQALVLQFLGGTGTLAFNASAPGGSSVVGVSPASGQISPNSNVFLLVDVNTAGLPAGPQRFVVRITTILGSVDVPILLFVSDAGPILALSQTGLALGEGLGGAPLAPQTVQVFNFGDPASTINWTATVLSGPDAVSFVGSPSGTATASQPGTLTMARKNVANGRFALIEVTAPNALNSPQYLPVAVSGAAGPSPRFELLPKGLVFTPGDNKQIVRVYTDSPTPVSFQVGTDAPGLISAPSSVTAVAGNPGQITVSANGSGTAGLSIASGAVVETVNLTSVAPPAGSTPASEIRTASGCSPSRLALTHTGMPNNFSVPAGLPATLIVQLNDDCGAPVMNGAVVANFSNGDPPLALIGDRLTGTYSATWQPGKAASSLTVTAAATAGSLAPASGELIGGVSSNQSPAPVLTRNGTVNNSNPVYGAALAPGTVAAVYGSGLALQRAVLGAVPLVTNFNGTEMLVGGLDAPLYYLNTGQLDVQIPFELAPNRQYQAIVSVNGALSLPDTLDTAPVSPGVNSNPDGTLAAQHADYSLVDPGHPAKPGEIVTIYLAGMGATNPAVASGQPAPGAPFAQVAVQPAVAVDGQNAAISFAGLTPGGVGLYQINFEVPPTARTGTLEVVVTQSGVAANTTTMPVAP